MRRHRLHGSSRSDSGGSAPTLRGRVLTPAAFTLVELLVVISIIGLLVALLLPAIEGARESARRTACGSKLKDLGTALHGYQARNVAFPPAGRGYSWCKMTVTTSGGRGVGDSLIYNSNGLVELLPFLNQRNLYDAFDHQAPFDDASGGLVATNAQWVNKEPSSTPSGLPEFPAGSSAGMAQNMRVARTYVAEFRCPSDTQSPNLGNDLCEATNYDFVCQGASSPNPPIGDRSTIITTTGTIQDADEGSACNVWRLTMESPSPSSRAHARMFGQNSATTPAHVRDGLSNTLAVAETTVYWAPHGMARWGTRPAAANGNGADPNTINNWTAPQGSQDDFFFPRRGVVAHNRVTTASLHQGGCQVVMGDGAVRFLSEQTAVSVIAQLKRIQDGNAPQDW